MVCMWFICGNFDVFPNFTQITVIFQLYWRKVVTLFSGKQLHSFPCRLYVLFNFISLSRKIVVMCSVKHLLSMITHLGEQRR